MPTGSANGSATPTPARRKASERCTCPVCGPVGAATGARAVEYEEILGYHLEQAYLLRAQLGSQPDSNEPSPSESPRPETPGGSGYCSGVAR